LWSEVKQTKLCYQGWLSTIQLPCSIRLWFYVGVVSPYRITITIGSAPNKPAHSQLEFIIQCLASGYSLNLFDKFNPCNDSFLISIFSVYYQATPRIPSIS